MSDSPPTGELAFIDIFDDNVILDDNDGSGDGRGPPTMADVAARFWPAYQRSYGKSIPWPHIEAIEAITRCRTPSAGGEVVVCSECGNEGYLFRSCRHRSCTKCNRDKGLQWYQDRRAELLPVPYFHIVFTVPEALRRLIRKHQRAVYPELMRAAADTLKAIGANPDHLGGEIAVMAVLHTWTRMLEYHPHVHCLVPSGYLDGAGQWHEVTRPWFAPRETLANVFRAKLCAYMRGVVAGLQLPGSIHRTPWVVHVDRPVDGNERVVKYLSRYVHRGPMSDSRILSINDRYVKFKYRDEDRLKWETMELKGREFLRRFLQHVTPKGFHRVRYYGLWSKASRPRLRALRDKLLAERTPDATLTSTSATPADAVPPHNKERKCPLCESGQLCRVGVSFERGQTPPPIHLIVSPGVRLKVPFPDVATHVAAIRRTKLLPVSTAPS